MKSNPFQHPPSAASKPAPKISVMMLAYNHERFLKQALESALMQQANFDCEIVIGDDLSTDNTRGIIAEYCDRFPGRIRALLPERNRGMNRNVRATLQACRGDYIAVLEGDDYWTSPLKLQLQADYLDAHPACALCFHPVQVVREAEDCGSEMFPANIPQQPVRIEDLLPENFIPTCSVLFRRRLLPAFPDWLLELQMVDWPLFLLLTAQGSADCIPQLMGAYRLHSAGLWTRKTRRTRAEAIIEMLQSINAHFEGRYGAAIRRQLAQRYASIAIYQEEDGLTADAARANWKALTTCPVPAYGLNFLRLCLKSSAPRLYAALRRSKDGARRIAGKQRSERSAGVLE